MAETAIAPRLMSATHEPDAAVACLIRRRVRGLLGDWGVDPERTDDAVLIVEELVANVLDHAHTRFDLELGLSGAVLRVAVRDLSDRSPQIRPVDPFAARGRGLQMVANLALRWGCERHAEGKTVWADLPAGGC